VYFFAQLFICREGYIVQGESQNYCHYVHATKNKFIFINCIHFNNVMVLLIKQWVISFARIIYCTTMKSIIITANLYFVA